LDNSNKALNRVSILKKDSVSIYKEAIVLFKTPLSWSLKEWTIISTFLLAFFVSMFFVDKNLRVWVQSTQNPFFDSVFSIFHTYGKVQPALILFLVFYFGGLLLKKEKVHSIGYKIFQLFIYSGLIVTILKSLIGRWRPFNGVGQLYFTPFVLGPNARLSLPSGDVAIAFTISFVFSSLYDNNLWKSFWYFIASLTTIGRIYHDQHWLSDVLLSAFITISIGVWQYNYFNQKSKTIN
jgi:membrane-associated phospholipid phosphatase